MNNPKHPLPHGWSLKKLGEIGTFSKGAGITKDELVESGIPCIRYGELYTIHDFVIREYKSFINRTLAQQSRRITKNDILMAGSGETLEDIGKAAAFVGEEEVYAGGDIIIFTPEPYVDSVCLSYLLNSGITAKQKSKLGQGNSVVHIYSKDLSKLEIPLPPLPEQQKIADILGTWDAALQTTTALLAQLEQRKKGLMQKLLSPKQDWQEVRLGECFERLTRRNAEGNTNVLTISAQHGLISQRDFFNKLVASEDVRGYFLLMNGEFAYNKSYSTGYPWGAYKRLDDYEKGILSPLYICFSLNKGNSDFFVHFFEAGRLNKGIYTIAQEGARNHGLLNMSIEDFFGIRFTIPPLAEQTRIAEILNAADAEIRETKGYLEKLKQQKKGLMQQLLTGKVRVGV